MGYKGKYSGQQLEELLDKVANNEITPDLSGYATKEELEGKQDTIEDLEAIRSGAAKGATALQSHQDISHLATKENIKALSDAGEVQQTQIAENKSRIDATAVNVNKLSEKVDKLNGDGEGSVKDIAAQEVAKVVASAPENLDDLKEIADFIQADATKAAEIVSTLNDHKKRLESLEKEDSEITVMSESQYDMLPEKEDKLYFLYED